MDVNTITPSKLGQAKKQRDALRNSVRNDIEKFRDKFGGSQFEVAHAILDVILDQANDYAKSYSKCEMTNDLAQTLLPETKSLIEAAGPAVNLISSVGESKLLTQDQLEKLLNPLLSDGEWMPINKNIVAKTSATMTKSLKLDTQVQLADCAGTTMVYSSKTYPSVKKLINELKATNKDKYFLHGKCFYGYNKAPEGMAQGWNYVIFAMRKNAPYILYTDLKKFSFYAPAGYKWRKLKNKPIYKLVKDTKQVSYWNKRYDKKAAKDTVTVAPALLGVAVPYEDAMSGKYVLPTGAHWETSIANPRHAIAVWTHATNPDGTPKFSSIGAIFPKPEAKSVVCTDSHGVSTPIWPNTAYLAVMTKYAPPVGWVWQKDITSHSVQLVKSTG